MSRDRRSLLDELGVDPSSSPVVALPPPAPTVAEGFVPASAQDVPSVDRLSPAFLSLDLGPGVPLRVGRHQVVPDVVCVEDAHQRVAGDARVVDDVVRLDGRAGRRSGATFETTAGRFAVEVGPEGLRVYRVNVENDSVGEIQRIPIDVELPALPELAFVGDPAVATFISELASSRSIVDRAAAVGMASRLHVPEHDVQKAVIEGRAPSPVEAVAEWAKRLDPTAREGLERLAVERAVQLRERLAQTEDDLGGEDLVSLLRERETLASVQELLWLARSGDRLSAELRGTDAIAVTKASYFVLDEALTEDDLLAAVASTDPDAWWATLGFDF